MGKSSVASGSAMRRKLEAVRGSARARASASVRPSRKAAKKGRDVDFRVASIEDLPFADGEFDAALSSFMIHHLPDDLKLRGLAEVRRVLKPGGRFVAVDLKPGKDITGFISHLIGHSLPDDYAEQLRSIISEAGFEDVEILEVKSPLALFIRARR